MSDISQKNDKKFQKMGRLGESVFQIRELVGPKIRQKVRRDQNFLQIEKIFRDWSKFLKILGLA